MTPAILSSVTTQIFSAVHHAEMDHPHGQQGAQKLRHATAEAEKIIDGAPIAYDQQHILKRNVRALIEDMVLLLNRHRVFKTTGRHAVERDSFGTQHGDSFGAERDSFGATQRGDSFVP